EVYYDVNRNVAVALNARLEITSDVMATRLRSPAAANQPVVLTADQLYRLNATTFELVRAHVFSSRLPSDPGLTVLVAQATVEDRTTTPRSLFGGPVIDRRTGRPLEQKETIVSAQDVTFEVEDVPFFYLPRVTANARDPLGPFESFNFGYNRIFG